jgi:hypothetical protein
VRKACVSTATRTGQVAVLVTRKTALHCRRVAAPEGNGQPPSPPPACRRPSSPDG